MRQANEFRLHPEEFEAGEIVRFVLSKYKPVLSGSSRESGMEQSVAEGKENSLDAVGIGARNGSRNGGR